ncbi:putative glycosyl hydrolase of unknown function (DUF1680) domain containing protein [Naviculisporaceae sp. PSN 640]
MTDQQLSAGSFASRLFLLVSLLFATSVSGHAIHNHHVVPRAALGDAASPFDMSQVYLTNSRWKENENRALAYLKNVNVDRLLYNFRANHKLSPQGATPNKGWDAPDFPFRTHAQGHYLNAWSYCYASLKDTTCRDRALYFVAELAKCQANNKAAGFTTGYLSGFPESEITAVEQRTLKNGNVPYYAIHKTMSGLLDVWRHLNDTTARTVLLGLAGWVDSRTGKLSYSQMQNMLGTEFGGMNDILAEIYLETGDTRWLTTAKRFDHASVFDPLASNQDRLNGLHANTQVPKWIGAAREYRATGDTKYRDIATNAWKFTVNAHTYAIGGNSQAEHFRPPNAIAGYLNKDTAEGCNTVNMLKLTRELFSISSNTSSPTASGATSYFDYYENALLNHLLGQQNSADPHGHITYFTSLNPGGRRGVGPAWGGGTWSTDYDSFWCCQGTALETNTKLMDSIYFHDARDESKLWVNQFIPSVLDWKEKGVKIELKSTFPVGEVVDLEIGGGAGDGKEWSLLVRVPGWVDGRAEIKVNGDAVAGQGAPGTYANVKRAWKAGDKVSVRLPRKLRTIAANDNAGIAALAFGPVVLAGNYGNEALSSVPALTLSTVKRVNESGLDFTATSGSRTVKLGPFYEARGFNYNVYWSLK